MKLSLLYLTLLMPFLTKAQKEFSIDGKIELLSKSTQIILNGSFGKSSAIINKDGSFKIIGTITNPCFGWFKTDSSSADLVWLEPGEYQVTFKEITRNGIEGYLLRTPELIGPQDARIMNGFTQPRYYFKGITADESMQKQKIFSIHFLDSLFKYFPNSKVLPEILRLSHSFIGDEATLMYQTLLNQEQKIDKNTRHLENYFMRKEKIEKEKYFENFSMTDDQGNNFKLSSLANKKLVLIDFWSSDCYPCRKNHEKLVELYDKYRAKGFEIISVSLDDNKKEWINAIQKDKMTWINVSELKTWNTSLAEHYFVKSIPFSIWLDDTRKIIGSELSTNEIEKYLK